MSKCGLKLIFFQLQQNDQIISVVFLFFLFISLFSIRPEMKWSQNKMSQTKFEPEGVFEESCSFESKRSSHASHASSLTCRELRTGDDSSAAPLIYKVNLLNPIRAQIRLFFFFFSTYGNIHIKYIVWYRWW